VEFKFRTPFAPTSGYAPFYAAADRFWPDMGLKVQVLPGTGSAAVIQTVGAGSEQMGYAGADSILAGIQQGVPITVVAVMARRDPTGVVYLESSGVKDWKDLEGKTIGNFPFGSTGPLVKAAITLKGVDADKVRFVNVSPGGEMALMSVGQLGLLAGFAGAQDIWLRCAGIPAGHLSTYEAGLELYGQAIIANNDWMRQVGDEVVRRAVLGAIMGATLLKSAPEEALASMMKQQPNTQTDRVQELAGLHPEGYTNWQYGGGPILERNGVGWVDESEMDKTQQGLIKAGLLNAAVDVSKVYTNKYLEDAAVKAAALQWVNTPWAPTPADVKQKCGLK
jgi:NitT/TauT family transport system substrate-binding protein